LESGFFIGKRLLSDGTSSLYFYGGDYMVKGIIENELIIAVDFDGTITTEPAISEGARVLQPNCKRVLQRLHKDGVKLILWTCRTGIHYDEAREFLMSEDMYNLFDAHNDNIPEVIAKYPDTARKVGADFYIDDKNMLCTGIDWLAIEEFIYGEGTD
jgi:hypothetical protein